MTVDLDSSDRSVHESNGVDRATIDDLAPDVPDRSPDPTFSERVADRLAWFWGDRRIGLAVAVAVSVLWALIAAQWTPRGPLTTTEAMWSLLISLAIGATAGLLMRSRWALLAAPVAFVVAFELGRLGTDGPTVDAPQFGTYGIIALVVGRGVHGLLTILPMLLGAALGAGAARTLDPDSAPAADAGRVLRRAGAVLAAVALVALSVGLLRPASTDTIVDADGDPVPGSVAELTSIDVNGHDLDVMIRGHSVDNPVILFLAGGPGGSELGAMRNHLSELEQHFTVATWDQRGTGKAYDQLDPTDTITLDGYVSDTLVVADYLRNRFDQDQIYLLGQSWGSTLGVLAVQERPQAFAAFIGVGQMVSQLATDRIFYDDTLAWAEANDNDGLVDELTDIGPPPYDEMLDYETALSYEHEVYPYDHSLNSEGEGGFSENFFVPEYTLIEQIHLLGAFLDTFAVLYPQLQDIDFRETATEFDLPMFFVQGAHEADGRAEPFAEWYEMIDAPTKDLTVLHTSGHRPLFEQPDEFVDYMVATVLAAPGES